MIVLLVTLAFTACGKDEDKKENDSKPAVTGEADVTSSVSPTESPTKTPEATPSPEPTAEPTKKPTKEPTATPEATPSPEPTMEPTKAPVSDEAKTAVLNMGDESYVVSYDSTVIEYSSGDSIEGMSCLIATDGSETEVDIVVYPDSDAKGLYDAWMLVLGEDNYSDMLGEELNPSLLGGEAMGFRFITGFEDELGYYNYEFFVDVDGVGAVGCSVYYFEATELSLQEILDAVIDVKINE